MIKQNPISKVLALILVSIGAAFLMLRIDKSALARLDSMSATDYVQRQRELFHHHSFVFDFLVVLIFGGFYIGIVKFISYVIGLFFRNRNVQRIEGADAG